MTQFIARVLQFYSKNIPFHNVGCNLLPTICLHVRASRYCDNKLHFRDLEVGRSIPEKNGFLVYRGKNNAHSCKSVQNIGRSEAFGLFVHFLGRNNSGQLELELGLSLAIIKLELLKSRTLNHDMVSKVFAQCPTYATVL